MRVLLSLVVPFRGLALRLRGVALVTGFVDAALADGGLAGHGGWYGRAFGLGGGIEGVELGRLKLSLDVCV